MLLWIAGLAFAGSPSKAERLEAIETAMEEHRRWASGQAELRIRGEELSGRRHAEQETAIDGLGGEVERLALRLAAAELEIARLTAALTTPPSKAGARLALLEAEVKRLSTAPPPPTAPTPGPDAEAAAKDLLDRATALLGPLHAAEARPLLAELATRFPDTRANRTASRVREELAVVGTHPGLPVATRWFTEPPRSGGTPLTLVVFWEAWCPHCQRELPRLGAWRDAYGERGLEVVALTRMTKGVTDAQVREFITTHALPFPVGLEDGSYSTALAVAGIPAAALIRDGEVLWRGHPAKLQDAWFAELLPAR